MQLAFELQQEQDQNASFANQLAQLEAQLLESTNALQELQVQRTHTHLDAAAEMASLRCSFRKRCSSGHSNAVRLACSLSLLEAELGSKRYRAAAPPNHIPIAL